MPLSTTELAQVMKAAPLNCENALNLDGGSSSQLRAQIGSFQLDVHGFSNVSDAVIVQAKWNIYLSELKIKTQKIRTPIYPVLQDKITLFQ